MFDSAEAQLDFLLRGTIRQLDIPPALYLEAVDRYRHVAQFLGAGEEFDDADLLIYPQGSFRLGTVVLPTQGGDYDIDLVLRVSIAKEATTQAALKEFAGQRLAEYVAAAASVPILREGGRCWTLKWRRFHMDVLPSLPNPADLPSGILLTDRDLRAWQVSNPIGFAEWFHGRMREQFIQRRKVLAADRAAKVEEVPAWEVKTTLQEAVQVLKRHRDLYFATRPSLKPPSILITTLAAHAYAGHDNLFEAVLHIAPRMAQFVENRHGIGWVANPVLPAENFADRWRTNPELRTAYEAWALQAIRDLEEAATRRGLDMVVERLSDGFGPEVRKAAESFGRAHKSAREAGTLASAGVTGLLVPAGSASTVRERTVPDHTFYGRH